MPPKSVFDMDVVTWGYFAKGYNSERQHLGADYRIQVGEEVLCHVDGTVTHLGRTKPDTYAVIWDGKFSHVFGHLSFAIGEGPIKAGQPIGTIIPYPTGAHLHYGMNTSSRLPLSEEWGWGKCPYSATKADAASRGWVDPVLNVFSRQLALGKSSIPKVLHR